MKLTHYIDARLCATSIERELHARLLTVVHHRILAGDALAVAWPGWQEEKGDFGLVLRIFGSEQALQRYTVAIAPLSERDLVGLSPISTVPDLPRCVVFARSRSVDRCGPSATRRMERRAKLRGHAFQPKRPARRGAHALTLRSSSTGKIFHMFVHRADGMPANGGGNHYGLGHAVPDF